MNQIVHPGTMVNAKRPLGGALREHSAHFVIFSAVILLLSAPMNPVRAAEIQKGATQLMRQPRTNFLYNCLPSEMQIPELKTLVEADTALPEKIILLPTVRSNEPPVRLAVHQRGSGTNRCVLVMIHGVLASHDS